MGQVGVEQGGFTTVEFHREIERGGRGQEASAPHEGVFDLASVFICTHRVGGVGLRKPAPRTRTVFDV